MEHLTDILNQRRTETAASPHPIPENLVAIVVSKPLTSTCAIAAQNELINLTSESPPGYLNLATP